MKEKKQIPTAVIPVKELGMHTKVQALQALFMTLASSLQPVVLQGQEGLHEIEPKIGQGVKTSIETALIYTCNRICAFMQDDQNWVDSDGDAREVLETLMRQAVEEVQQKEITKRQPRRQKGAENDEQK